MGLNNTGSGAEPPFGAKQKVVLAFFTCPPLSADFVEVK